MKRRIVSLEAAIAADQNRDLDHEWLTNSLGMDATYIARLTMEGKQAEAASYIERSNYLERLAQWKAGK